MIEASHRRSWSGISHRENRSGVCDQSGKRHRKNRSRVCSRKNRSRIRHRRRCHRCLAPSHSWMSMIWIAFYSILIYTIHKHFTLFPRWYMHFNSIYSHLTSFIRDFCMGSQLTSSSPPAHAPIWGMWHSLPDAAASTTVLSRPLTMRLFWSCNNPYLLVLLYHRWLYTWVKWQCKE